MNKIIQVTQPDLPDLNEFVKYLEQIWDSKWITNNGKFHQQLESELAAFLGVKYMSLFSNGTLALMTALQALRITGEVITTPYTFVATTNALVWNGLKPVFVDVDPLNGNMDPMKIISAITKDTTAILPVHVYGNYCDVDHIQEIADTYGLKVVYDAAHAFGVKKKNQSILNFGDLSILSFHATKVFNTIEGGAIICHDKKTKIRVDYLKNFGFAGETNIIASGINAKMNELQAAYGLLQLNSIKENIHKRQKVALRYDNGLKDIEGIRVLQPKSHDEHNYSYYPIFIDRNLYGKSRDDLYEYLKLNNIFGRRYFYPLVSSFSMFSSLDSSNEVNLSNAHSISEQVICLPIYPTIELEYIDKIINLIR
jgi:dTDP-4-amino-4,6-dideoxygalactose transaminase